MSSPWNGPGVVGGEEAVRLKAVISVVNHDRMKACHARKVPPGVRGNCWADQSRYTVCVVRRTTANSWSSATNMQGVVPWQFLWDNCKAGQALV